MTTKISFEEYTQKYEPDVQFEKTFETILQDLERYISDLIDQGLEVEFRLGLLENSGFNPNIGEDLFYKIKNVLDSADCWAEKEFSHTTDYKIEDHPPVRLSYDKEGTFIQALQKQRLKNLDFEYTNTPFDIRLSFSQETPIETKELSEEVAMTEASHIRDKERTSYVYQNPENGSVWYYDLTIVTTDDNSLEVKSYEVELECIYSQEESVFHFLNRSLCKVRDIVNMCEEVNPGDENKKLELISD